MADEIVPSGCRWCGAPHTNHYGFWSEAYRAATGNGWHRYVPPTLDQIRDRMRARRAARKDNHRG